MITTCDKCEQHEGKGYAHICAHNLYLKFILEYPVPESYCTMNPPNVLKLLQELSDIQPPELRLLKAERILKIFEPDK